MNSLLMPDKIKSEPFIDPKDAKEGVPPMRILLAEDEVDMNHILTKKMTEESPLALFL